MTTPRRALLTGATGFVGRAVARRLHAAGWRVAALLRPGSDASVLAGTVDASDRHVHDGSTESMVSIVAAARPDVVVHLATRFVAEHAPGDIAPMASSNLLLPMQLAEAATRAGVRGFLNAGTAWQHGIEPGGAPVNLYAATKQAAEDLLRWYHDARGLSCLTLVLFDTYGPADPRRKLVGALVDAARDGTRLALSPGGQLLDLLHVDDVAGAFLVAAERLLEAPAPCFEHRMASGERLTLETLVRRVERLAGRPLDACLGARPYRAREVMRPWTDDAARLPGWAPTISLDEGLRRLLAAPSSPPSHPDRPTPART